MELSPDNARELVFDQEPTTWYDSHQHMLAVSRKWPNTIFSLDCQSDDRDHSVTFYRGSRSLNKEYHAPTFNEAEFGTQATETKQ